MVIALTQGIYQRANENEDLVNINLRICVPIIFGIFIFLLSLFKTLIYFKIILKTDLSNKQNLIKKGMKKIKIVK